MNSCNDKTYHSLLDRPQPNYSLSTLRRAFLVWLHCGHQNKFQDICKYYHYLEAMEARLPANRRGPSYSLEMRLVCDMPPNSSCLQENFPNLYRHSYMNYNGKTWDEFRRQGLANFERAAREYRNRAVRFFYKSSQKIGATKNNATENNATKNNATKNNATEKNAIEPVRLYNSKKCEKHEILAKKTKTEKTEKVAIKEAETKKAKETEVKRILSEGNGTSKREILEVSQMIRSHCKNQLTPLNIFLNEFEKFAIKCELKNTVSNVGFYIKMKIIHAELQMIKEQKENTRTLDNIGDKDDDSSKDDSNDDFDDKQKKLMMDLKPKSFNEDLIDLHSDTSDEKFDIESKNKQPKMIDKVVEVKVNDFQIGELMLKRDSDLLDVDFIKCYVDKRSN